MRKARLLAVSALIAAMSIVPLAGPAQAGCPDPDNPCDPPPMQIDPLREIKCKLSRTC